MRKRTVAIIMMMIIGVGIGLVYYYITLPGLDETCISQQLYANGDGNTMAPSMNAVIVPSCLLIESTEIEEVLSDYEQITLVFYSNDAGKWSSWVRGEPWNSLTHFVSGETYYFKVAQDILFEI